MSGLVTDEEIQAAIEQNDDPDHADALTIDDVRDLLDAVQQSFEMFWMEHMDAVEEGHLEVVADTGSLAVLADHTGHVWGDELDALDLNGQDRGIVASVFKTIHHEAARQHSDYSWATADPVVVEKPDANDAGQRYVEAVVNALMREGLSPGQAWAVYGVRVAGHSRNMWASMCGYSDHSAISEPLRKGEEKAGHLGLLR